MDERLRGRDNNLKYQFDGAVLAYDKMRPTYVPALFADVTAFAGLGSGMRALEVGIGTGQATLPFLQTGCKVTAIEIGAELARFCREKFAAYPNFEVFNTDFESAELADDSYDLFYCASAFHWIPREIGYPKVFRILKPGGTLALFLNRPFPASEDDPTHLAMQKVYDKYLPAEKGAPKRQSFCEADCAKILEPIRQYGFAGAHYKLYDNARTPNAEEYVLLTNTYSDHLALPEERRRMFEQEIAEAINSCGGSVTLHDTIDLYLAKKPGCGFA